MRPETLPGAFLTSLFFHGGLVNLKVGEPEAYFWGGEGRRGSDLPHAHLNRRRNQKQKRCESLEQESGHVLEREGWGAVDS